MTVLDVLRTFLTAFWVSVIEENAVLVFELVIAVGSTDLPGP
jgi:hypothetical protein